MRRRRLAVGIGIALAAALAAGNLAGRYTGASVQRLAPAELSALLSPAYRTATPAGQGPFPTVLLFSGCDGPKDSMDRWSAALVAHGWATIIVDSHGPRGLDRHALWRLVCAGQLLMGSERAGDVLVALADARAMPFADPHRLVLLGASHGGWAIMELLAMDPPEALPYNLAAAPGPGDPLAGLAGTVLLYPYCGEANRANPEGWTRPVPTLMLLAGADSIVDPQDCARIAGRLAARGLRVDVRTLAGVDHGFDQAEKAPLSTLDFDPAATAAAIAAALAFLDALPPAR